MAGRFFDSGNLFGDSSDPWFRVGTVDVTTTVAVVATGVLSMFIWAFEGDFGPIFRNLALLSDNFGQGTPFSGEIWRLITWPIPNEPDIWNVLLFFFFFVFGNQLERIMGRKPFLWFLVTVTVLPALLIALVDLGGSLTGFAFGFRFLQLGVITAWASQYPQAKFFGIIPAPVGVGVIIVIDILQALSDRNNFSLIMVLATVVVSLVTFRSFGHAPEVPQIPKVPLPAFMTGQAQPRASRPPKRSAGPRNSKPKGRRRGKANLKSVPPPVSSRPKYQSSGAADQEMDALLDQVADSGYDSLTEEQKRRLQEHSKRLRDDREN